MLRVRLPSIWGSFVIERDDTKSLHCGDESTTNALWEGKHHQSIVGNSVNAPHKHIFIGINGVVPNFVKAYTIIMRNAKSNFFHGISVWIFI